MKCSCPLARFGSTWPPPPPPSVQSSRVQSSAALHSMSSCAAPSGGGGEARRERPLVPRRPIVLSNSCESSSNGPYVLSEASAPPAYSSLVELIGASLRAPLRSSPSGPLQSRAVQFRPTCDQSRSGGRAVSPVLTACCSARTRRPPLHCIAQHCIVPIVQRT